MLSGDFDPSALPSALVGKPLPAFALPSLADPSVLVRPRDLQGSPSLLNVWATWCVSCRVEHAFLLELADRGVPVFGLNYKDQDVEANLWLERLGNPYQLNIVDADGALGLDMGVYGAPETYVLSGDGRVLYRHVGVLDQRVWSERILPLLPAAPEAWY